MQKKIHSLHLRSLKKMQVYMQIGAEEEKLHLTVSIT